MDVDVDIRKRRTGCDDAGLRRHPHVPVGQGWLDGRGEGGEEGREDEEGEAEETRLGGLLLLFVFLGRALEEEGEGGGGGG